MSKKIIESAIAALEAASSFIEGFEDDETQEGVVEMLQDIAASIAGLGMVTNARVLVTVSGGVAEVETFGPVDYELLDFDNLEADGQGRDERNARYERDKHWLETGEVLPEPGDEENQEP